MSWDYTCPEEEGSRGDDWSTTVVDLRQGKCKLQPKRNPYEYYLDFLLAGLDLQNMTDGEVFCGGSLNALLDIGKEARGVPYASLTHYLLDVRNGDEEGILKPNVHYNSNLITYFRRFVAYELLVVWRYHHKLPCFPGEVASSSSAVHRQLQHLGLATQEAIDQSIKKHQQGVELLSLGARHVCEAGGVVAAFHGHPLNGQVQITSTGTWGSEIMRNRCAGQTMQSEASPSVQVSSLPIPIVLSFQDVMLRLNLRDDPFGQTPPPPLGNPPSTLLLQDLNKEGEWRKAWSTNGQPFWWNTARLGEDGLPLRSWTPPELPCPVADSAVASSIARGPTASSRATSSTHALPQAIPGDLLAEATLAMRKGERLHTATASTGPQQASVNQWGFINTPSAQAAEGSQDPALLRQQHFYITKPGSVVKDIPTSAAQLFETLHLYKMGSATSVDQHIHIYDGSFKATDRSHFYGNPLPQHTRSDVAKSLARPFNQRSCLHTVTFDLKSTHHPIIWQHSIPSNPCLQPFKSSKYPPSCLVMSEGAAAGAHLTALACNETLLVQSGSLVILLWDPVAVKEWGTILGDKVLYVNEETAEMTRKYRPHVLHVSQGQILQVHAGCALSIVAKETAIVFRSIFMDLEDPEHFTSVVEGHHSVSADLHGCIRKSLLKEFVLAKTDVLNGCLPKDVLAPIRNLRFTFLQGFYRDAACGLKTKTERLVSSRLCATVFGANHVDVLAHLKDQTLEDPNFVLKPSDLNVQHVTLVCNTPPVGLRGEIVVALSGVMYRPQNGVYTSLDGSATWPSEYHDRNGILRAAKSGDVLVFFWEANKLVTLPSSLNQATDILDVLDEDAEDEAENEEDAQNEPYVHPSEPLERSKRKRTAVVGPDM
mmetsp:Transcript_33676/g.82796  ORF Transcript_33676/g.82796 Transcript_33676/m.82796 type:complete len:881 (-) Transcript_33676:819-3461(-)